MKQIVSRATKSLAVIGGAVVLGAGLVGCAGISHQSPSLNQTESRAEGQHTTAQSYLHQAEMARTEAEAYERKADSLGRYTDTKGFIRSSFITAAQASRAKARNLEELAAIHEGQSELASR